MMKINKIQIHKDALIHNFFVVKSIVKDGKIAPVLKANAFSHGLLRVAHLFEREADAFMVARLEEARLLLLANIKIPIVVMSGIFNLDILKSIDAVNLQIAITTLYQLEQLKRLRLKHKLTVWLKINTGMHRLGLPMDDIDQKIRMLKKCSVVKEIILMTHLASANREEDLKTRDQCSILLSLAQEHSLQVSIANSAAILQYSEARKGWVRPGIMLYGASPTNKDAAFYNLMPTMTLSTYLLDVRYHRKGDEIGYEGIWTCANDILLGVIPIGYGDGYPRNVGNAYVWINGTFCNIVGRISMDLITIDLSKCPNAKVGDYVEMWGKNLSIDNVAKFADSIPNELLTRISPRHVASE